MSYLPLATEKVKKYFLKFVEPTDNFNIWFDYKGQLGTFFRIHKLGGLPRVSLLCLALPRSVRIRNVSIRIPIFILICFSMPLFVLIWIRIPLFVLIWIRIPLFVLIQIPLLVLIWIRISLRFDLDSDTTFRFDLIPERHPDKYFNKFK